VADRPASLRRTILVWLVLATAAIGALALVDTRIEALRTAREVSDRVLIGSAMAIAEGVSVDAEGRLAISIPFSALDMLSSTAQDQVFYRVDGPAGTLTGYQDLSPIPVPTDEDTALADASYKTLPIRTATLQRELTTGEGTLPFTVTVAETTRAREALATSILTRSALRIAGLIAGAALVAWTVATYALRPLDRLSRAIAAREPHDLTPIRAEAPDELRPVLDALNGFLSRLAKAMTALQNFASNANHQIRTPLTVARTQIAMSSRDTQRPEALTKADAALIRIERVLQQVLLLARVEATGTRPQLQTVDVAALARNVTADLLPQAMRRHQDLGYDGPDQLLAWSEEVLLEELLRNLVGNALNHSPERTVVTVHVGPGPCLRVEDTGPALPDATFETLKGRLTPDRAAEEARLGTHGLGLHIVAEIARALQAEIALDRGADGIGLAVTVRLPAMAG
jgi:two-component system sensor histidine kinase TctE